MDPITLSVLSGVLFYVIDKRRKKTTDHAVPSLDQFTLPTIGAAEVESFTHVTGADKTRQFDRLVSDGMPALLAVRSLVPISQGPIGRVAPAAKVYRVVPLAQGLQTAADVIALARTEGQIVLSSLSLIGLTWGSDDAMLVIVGGPELKSFVSSPPGVRGDFALLPPRVERVVVEVPAKADVKDVPLASPVEEVATVVEAKPAESKSKAKANGAAKDAAAAPIVTTTAEVAKE